MEQSLHTDPLLGEISELLHRMTTSEDKALGWLAWDAIRKLREYESKAQGKA